MDSQPEHILGNVSVSQLRKLAKEAGQPVLYYVISKHSTKIKKRYMTEDGYWVQHPLNVKWPAGDPGLPRFTNYFLAYGYMLRRRKQRELEKAFYG